MERAALILEGGGMRGLYTAGALDFLLDKQLVMKTVYGVSAGACHACSYLSGQRGRARSAVVDFLDDWRYASARSFLRTGDYFGVGMVYDEIPNRLLPYDYEAFRACGAAFYAVATDMESGEPAYLRVEDMQRDLICIRASSSLPLLSRKVEIGGRHYLDGGMADSIPLARAIADGCTRNLVILTQHRGYQKQPASMLRLMRLRYRRYPGLVEAMARRHERYNAALELACAEEEAGRAVVIQPREPVTIDRLEKDRAKLDALYESGYEDARTAWDRVSALLAASDHGARTGV